MLRWHRFRNPVTAVQVDDYRRAHLCSMQDAFAALQKTTEWKLQYFDADARYWCDVPHVEEPHSPE